MKFSVILCTERIRAGRLVEINIVKVNGDLVIDGKPLADCVERISDFAGKVMGEPAISLGGILGDFAAEFRYRNLLRVSDWFESIIRKRRQEGKVTPIPPRLAIPLLEAASLEDDQGLQHMWAALIANSVDPERDERAPRIFIETLRQMEPLDARILGFMCEPGVTIKYYAYDNPVNDSSRLNLAELVRCTDGDEETIALALQNLSRLGLVIDSWMNEGENMGRGFAGFRVHNPRSNFRPSDLGRSLHTACSDS